MATTRPREKLHRRRRRTRLWFTFYTIALGAIFVLSIVARQWSIAGTSLLIAALFALLTRWLWRRC